MKLGSERGLHSATPAIWPLLYQSETHEPMVSTNDVPRCPSARSCTDFESPEVVSGFLCDVLRYMRSSVTSLVRCMLERLDQAESGTWTLNKFNIFVQMNLHLFLHAFLWRHCIAESRHGATDWTLDTLVKTVCRTVCRESSEANSIPCTHVGMLQVVANEGLFCLIYDTWSFIQSVLVEKRIRKEGKIPF